MNNQAKDPKGAEQSKYPLEQYSVQPPKEEDKSPYYKSAAPSLALPKGGGALKGIDEKFSVNAVNGTASVELPLPLSPGRGGFTPALSISYNSGGGNSEFGLGWGLSLPAIQRKTDKRLPEYNDAEESDVFLLAGAEDLIPMLDAQGQRIIRQEKGLSIKAYRPRIEGLFARIELIESLDNSWWRVTTKENITTYYGLDTTSRIADPESSSRIFKWLPTMVVDQKGNVQVYQYVAENFEQVMPAVYEKNRLNGTAPCTNTYLKAVLYGNKSPFTIETADCYQPLLPVNMSWYFEAKIDYGDHSEVSYAADQVWAARADAFSSFHAGFEIRTYRKAKRVLMFHRFPGLNSGAPTLVRSLELVYAADQATAPVEADYIIKAISKGYKWSDANSFRSKALPAMEMSYSPLQWNTEIQKVAAADFKGAPQGLTGPYQWIDLDGEGISGILSEQAGSWWYKHNLGNGHFSEPKQVAEKPSYSGLGSELQFQDLDGDGRRQVVEPNKGFWQLDGPDAYTAYKRDWAPYCPFEQVVQINWDSPFTKMLDLNGDGKADVLITEDRAWTWWENLGKQGFTSGGHSPIVHDEEKGPVLLLRDSVQSIFLADINGDGLTDLVRVRNGEICYWPNKGYGRFGAKVSMENAPIFDQQDAFNPQYISLSDISGTGAADIIYTGKNSCTAYINYSGNAWGEAVHINPLPATDSYSKLAVMDFLGKGTGCLVWSSPLAAHAAAPLQYIDLMQGLKPHLMVAYENGMGKAVSLEYKSSTQYYLEDKEKDIRWASRLPFPVQCVEKVTTYDKVSDSRFAQSYRYRHGYYDHEEREFRGFGYVETVDIDSVDHTAGSLDQDPVLTKSWYHTGAWMRGDALHTEFAKEYLAFEGWDTPLEDGSLLPIINIEDQSLNVLEQREAYRTLKGSPLRQEVYALPQGMDPHIYTVTAFTYTVKCIQKAPQGEWLAPKHGSFMSLQQQQIAFSCEGNREDPRISHSFVLATDQYGQVEKQASIAYARRHPDADLPDVVKQEQAKTHINYSVSRYTNGITNQALNYRLPLPYEQMAYEMKIAPPAGALYTIDELKNATFYTVAIDYFDTPAPDTKRLLSHSKTLFYNDTATAALAFGELQPQAIPYESYQKAYSNTGLSLLYGNRFSYTMIQQAGYVNLLLDGDWWLPSGRALYTVPADKFYNPERFVDPWNKETSVAFWDNSYLLPKSTTDALGNTSSILDYNWHNLQPVAMKDANENISEILYDALGMAVAMALKGKDNGTEGDSLLADLNDDELIDVDGSADLANQAAFWQDPDTYAEELLQHASWRCVYDWSNGPARVAMIACSEHTFGASVNDPHFLIRMSYSDGLGRVLMHKHNCEPIAIPPDAPPAAQTTMAWIGTGRTVYNNKGNAVMQYEPYFSVSHECDTTEQAAAQGVSPRLYYDPLGRVQETRMPDGTFSRTVWTSWQQAIYDANDTVLESWWYAERIDDGMGAEEAEAAQKAAAHANTPTVVHTDSLARGFYTLQYLEPATVAAPETLESYEILDILGNRLKVIDAAHSGSDTPVACLEYRYNMLQAPCRQQSIDSGMAHTILDVAGQPLYAWDTEDRRTRMWYDALRRPEYRTLNFPGEVKEYIVEHWVYGETHTNAASYNMRGALWLHYDQSGKQTVARYDFKGAPRETQQQLLAAQTVDLSTREGTIDWTNLPESTLLSTEVFEAAVQYDGLGRPVLTTDPGENTQRMQYNRSGALQKLWLNGVAYVNDMHHDAKGQRLAIWYGNGTKTSYTYDTLNYRLSRMLTVKPGEPDKLQDLRYTYDPSGNITQIKDAAQQTVFYANSIIEPVQLFTYDALYRLIEASGREQVSSNSTESFDDAERMTTLGSDACRNYTQKYTYDVLGNILKLQHIASGGNYTRTYGYEVSPGSQLDNTTMGGVTANYLHDARGNMMALPHLYQMGWNAHNELAYIQKTIGVNSEKAWYQYAGGERIRKYVNKGNIKEERIYLDGFEIYRKFEGSSLILERHTIHVSDDSGRIALLEKRTPIGTDDSKAILTRYIYSNHLQSASLELDENAAIVSYEEYHPYGTTAFQAKSATINAIAKRYRYTGKERDEESGLYYHGARYYIPWLCRWTAIDPMESKYAGMSPYNYSFNNPIMFNDLSGADPGGLWAEVKTSNGNFLYSWVEGAKSIGQIQDMEEYKNKRVTGAYNSFSFVQGKERVLLTSEGNEVRTPIDGTTSQQFAEGFGNGYMGSYKNAKTLNFSDLIDIAKSAIEGLSFMNAIIDDEYSKTHEEIFGNNTNPDESSYPRNHNKTRDKFIAGILGMDAYDWGNFTGQTTFEALTSYAAGKAVNPYPKFGKTAGTLTIEGELPMVAPKVNSQKILSRPERLELFKEKLASAPKVTNVDEAIKLINTSLDDVEDMFSGIIKDVNAVNNPNRSDGRMYGILDDAFVTRHKDGSVTAKTRGHIIEIKQNGIFSIFDRKGNLFYTKK